MVAKRGLDVVNRFAEGGAVTEETVPGMAEAIEDRRQMLHLSPSDFARVAGVSLQGLVPVRAGARRKYQAKVRNGVARALQWPVDWYDRLIEGENWRDFQAQVISLPVIDGTQNGRLTALEERFDRLEEKVQKLVERSEP